MLNTIKDFNASFEDLYPNLVGIKIIELDKKKVTGEIILQKHHIAPNGFLHGGLIVSLADTVCACGTIINLGKEAKTKSFATIELKTNFLSTTTEGIVRCIAEPIHIGKKTQVWDAVIESLTKKKKIAYFRNTQMIFI